MLRDPKVERFGPENLAELQRRIRDPNWRIFAEDGLIYATEQHSLPVRRLSPSSSSIAWTSSIPRTRSTWDTR